MFLDGERASCRIKECNLANLVVDALIHTNAKQPDGKKWADVGIAIWNSGGIRTSIDKLPNGKSLRQIVLKALSHGTLYPSLGAVQLHILRFWCVAATYVVFELLLLRRSWFQVVFRLCNILAYLECSLFAG